MKQNSKKIIIVVNTSWNIYNFRLNIARSLKKEGHEVVLIAPYDKYSELLSKEFEYHEILMNNKGVNPIEDTKTLIDFYKLYKKIKPDIVLHYTIKPNIYGTLAASLLKIKTINNIAGLGTLFVKQGLVTKIAKYLYKYSQDSADKVFFQNRDDFELFTKENLVDKNKCNILPGSGVDTRKFIPIKYQNNDNVTRFLLISRILWEKGIQEYVDAAKMIKTKYPNTEFQLLGFIDENDKKAVPKKQIQAWEDLGIVKYLGTSDNVMNEISQTDCIVLPSYYREGTPRVLLESASMAKPIITTDNVGCRDVVDYGINGFLCKMKDSKDLSNKMEQFLELTDRERDRMGQEGREKILNEFDEKIVINKYLEVIGIIS